MHSDSLWPKKILRALVFGMTLVFILGASWATGTAILENVHFARGTDQILQLVTAAHSLAARDKNFAMQPNEDILDDLIRTGLITGNADTKPVTFLNPWQGTIRSLSSQPSLIRIESNLPAHDCRRLAMFLIKNGKDLGLVGVEARSDGDQTWKNFYDVADSSSALNNQTIEDACQQAPLVTVAFIFNLR